MELPSESRIKEIAKMLKKEHPDRSHCQLLHALAKSYGFKSFIAYKKALKAKDS